MELKLLEANKFDVPPSLAGQQLEHLLERLRGRLLGNRPLPEADAKELREKLKPQAENDVRMQFLLAEIGRVEGEIRLNVLIEPGKFTPFHKLVHYSVHLL